MAAYTHVYTDAQDAVDEPYALSVEEILNPEFGTPAADDMICANQFWNQRADRFLSNMTRNAIFQEWRNGAIGSVEAFNALMSYDVLDFDVVVGLYSDYHLALAAGEVA